MEAIKKFKLGLDIGTNSVGYALLDENNKVVRKNGHSFWGVRMFEESSDAKSRRNYRSNRRRLQRRKQRIVLLQELFNEEIKKVDKNFFIRLNDSFYKVEDKHLHNTYNLFADKNYSDYDFFKQFPTIYHLRKYLMETKQKVDIRFLYLAIAHILKYRGNFLSSGEEFKQSDFSMIRVKLEDINSTLVDLSQNFSENENYDEEYFEKIDINQNNFFDDLKNCMVEEKGLNNKKKKLLTLFNVGKKTLVNEFVIPLIAGSTINLSNISIIKNEKYEKVEVSLDSEDLEAKQNDACTIIKELSPILCKIELLKEVFDYYYVLKILKGVPTISDAMVKIYDDHQQDLIRLKKLIKKYKPEIYSKMFRELVEEDKEKKKNKIIMNYPRYVGYNKVGVYSFSDKQTERFGHASRQDFYKFIKEQLAKITDESAQDEIKYFLGKIDNDDFLLKQKSNKNGALPMQLHLVELKMILNNQKEYYPFLNEKDSDGLTISDKIISIFKFKIPYYVGPLNIKSDFAWIERNNEKIYPWNFEKVVDLDQSAIKFIERMQNKCTYLKGENDYCLPKSSIIFSEYNCLSYLNKLRINGEYISNTLKEKIYNELFLNIEKKQPTRKDLKEFIEANYGDNALVVNIKEIPEINCNMASYIDMKRIFCNDFDKYKDIYENIIKDITVFEDKAALEKRLSTYNLPKEIIKRLKGLNYNKYSSLSGRLLNGITIFNPKTGEVQGTVLEIMRKTNLNLQEILYLEDYKLIDIIDKENKKNESIDDKKIEEYLDEYVNISPLYKRPLIQSYRIIKEIETIFNRPIDEYYIECTRTSKALKKQSSSRYETLKELYKNCEKDALSMNIDMKELEKNLDECKDSLKSDILYLYFTQLGRCMYTLEPIDISELKNNKKYDIDHIYPQAIIKDDSLSNRVLVDKTKNNKKSDIFLYESDVLNPNAYSFFKKLYDMRLISKEKYNRLTEKEIPESKLDSFVNRQLVTTNQAVTGLIQVLKEYHNVNPINIVYSKSENVTDFRKKFDLVKSRTANNFHHAHDAYLNVVVGGIIHKYFSYRHFNNKYKDIIRMKNERQTLNVDKLLDRDIVKNGEKIIWNKNEMIKQIKHDLYQRFDISETIRTYNSNELFPKVKILPASKDKLVPVKSSNAKSLTQKYGGLKSDNFYKYIIIETNEKNKKKIALEAIPKSAEKDLDEYLKSKGYSNYSIINDNIKINTCVMLEGRKFIITGKTNDSYVLKNTYDRFFSYEDMKIIKKIDKYLDNKSKKVDMNISDDKIIISPARSEKNKEIVLTLQETNKLLDDIYNMYSKKIYSYSSIKTIIENKNKTINLSFLDKIIVCSELLYLLKTNERKSADLQLLGQSKDSGILKISKNLPIGTKLIEESYTGYYKKVIYEVK